MPGTYDITASLEGYAAVTIEDVFVESEVTTSNIDFTLEVAAAPANFAVEVLGFNDVYLSWDTPATIAVRGTTGKAGSKANSRRTNNLRSVLEGFNVYKEGELLAMITDPGTTSFDDLALDAGEYEYCVSAVYDVGESTPTDEVIAIVFLETPTNVTAVTSGTGIVVSWVEPMENRELGTFNVYRDSELIADNITETSYLDENVPTGNYTYNITAVYDGGWESEFSEPAIINHTDAANNLIPTATELVGNFPNPFNPVTNISFSMEFTGHVTLEIYNIRGEKVKTLVNEELEPGYYSKLWNGKSDNDKSAASGIYFYKMKAGVRYSSTRKMILLK